MDQYNNILKQQENQHASNLLKKHGLICKQMQFACNIHAKALRKLPGYNLVTLKFADDFRSLAKGSVAKWPGIRLDYGPTTLLVCNFAAIGCCRGFPDVF